MPHPGSYCIVGKGADNCLSWCLALLKTVEDEGIQDMVKMLEEKTKTSIFTPVDPVKIIPNPESPSEKSCVIC